jgi:hypothetical protein
VRLGVPIAALGLVLGLETADASAEEALRLVLEQGAARTAVAIVLENAGAAPVRVYVDSRLAGVELRTHERMLARCPAPLAAVRDPDERRFVVLEPGQRAREALDLRFHCFGPRLPGLAQAEAVRVTYRSRVGANQRGEAAWTGHLGPVSLTLPAEPEGGGSETGQREVDQRSPVALRQRGGPVDVTDGTEVPVAMELRAAPRARLPVVVRPAQFAFAVVGPDGSSFDCGLPQIPIDALRDFYERLGVRRIVLDLGRLCPRNALSISGVYEVRPSFSSEHDGQDVGLRAWTGEVEGQAFLLRVRQSRGREAEPVAVELLDATGER